MSTLDDVVLQMADRIRLGGRGDWIAGVERKLSGSRDLLADTNILISGARRVLGSELVAGLSDIGSEGAGASSPQWTFSELGRAYVLAKLLQMGLVEESNLEDFVTQVYRYSDDAEKEAIIKSLAFLPDNERFKPLALDATRTNSKVLLSALLVRNGYPAARFSDKEFNGLVLKALFLRIGISAIPGLEDRANPDLSRMCEDYVQELRDAGREVPADIWLAVAGHLSRRGGEFLREYGAGQDPQHRYYAALAIEKHMSRSGDWREFVRERRERETDESVLEVLNRITA